jgi:hypothetical protein
MLPKTPDNASPTVGASSAAIEEGQKAAMMVNFEDSRAKIR